MSNLQDNTRKMTPEEIIVAFKDDLKSVLVVIRELAPICPDTKELIDLLELAEVNPSQLRLIMQRILKVQMG
jgi:hypothetical protein